MIAELVRNWLPPILFPYVKAATQPFRRLSPRQLALRAEFLKSNEGAPPNVIRLRPEVSIVTHPEARVPFEMFCWRAPEMVEEMDSFIRLTSGRKNLLDVGALHGVFTLVFAAQDSGRRVIAVDPSPMAFSKLIYNIRKNRFDARVTAVECALSDSVGTLPMFYEWEHAVAAPLEPESEVAAVIEKTTGDALCAEFGFVPDVIKMDIEGHEVKAIRGLAQTIRAARPLIFLELHADRIRQEKDDLAELLGFFEDLGYRATDSAGVALSFRQLAQITNDTRIILEA